MKKVLIIGAVAMVALASCKKDYTCECTYTSGGSTSTVSVVYKDVKKKDAEAACTSYASTGGSTWSCAIK